MVSIRKMHPAAPGTTFGARAEGGASAAARAALPTAEDGDFLGGDNRLV